MHADTMQGAQGNQESIVSATRFRPVPWQLRDLLRGSLAALGLLLLGAIAAAVVAALAGMVGADMEDPRIQGVMAVVIMGLEAVFILPAWRWGPSKYRVGIGWLGVHRAPLGRTVLYTLLGLAVILLINMLWAQAMQRFGIPGQPDLVPIFGTGLGSQLVALLVVGGIAPVAEEVFFRGFLYAGLRDAWGVGKAILVSAVIFGLVHMSLSTLVPILAMGAVFAYLYERTDTLWASIALHAVINTLGVLAAYAAR
ncbi:MAG: CPBP family intramembrane glutamic endopeptidase [Anaerolineae bacterium]|jgi:membrane protease YdiL (CAAX protease family)|nr:CPBP family intramembrane metalloprotease [Chloroflexota bacterium]